MPALLLEEPHIVEAGLGLRGAMLELIEAARAYVQNPNLDFFEEMQAAVESLESAEARMKEFEAAALAAHAERYRRSLAEDIPF